ILTVTGGAVPGDAHAFRLYENPGNGNHWISLHLVGVKTNRAALGARIKVSVLEGGKIQRSIYRTVGSGGSFGASPLQQHIGLGKSAETVNLEIWWPTSNTRQNFTNLKVDQFLEIKEFATEYSKLEKRAFRLGGNRRPPPSSTHP
ncbi:MAG: ASPIC/UnbV domain-containing protein, partial [Terriglobales bacterium]